MAEVYDNVPGVPGFTSHQLPNGDIKTSRSGKLERVIALHGKVQRRLIKEGRAIYERADFRMQATQVRHIYRLRELVAEAIKTGDPELIRKTQDDLNYYMANRTQVVDAQADVDYHIMLYRPDGREFFVEVDGQGDRGVDILKKSLTH